MYVIVAIIIALAILAGLAIATRKPLRRTGTGTGTGNYTGLVVLYDESSTGYGTETIHSTSTGYPHEGPHPVRDSFDGGFSDGDGDGGDC